MSSNQSSIHYSLDSFGPTLSTGFDFTLLFENTVLSILPSALLLLLIPFRLASLYGKPRKVSRSLLYENKLVRIYQAKILRPYSSVIPPKRK